MLIGLANNRDPSICLVFEIDTVDINVSERNFIGSTIHKRNKKKQ